MKTSNKLLLIPFLLCLGLGLMGMVYLRSSLVPYGIGDGGTFIKGEGIYKKKELPVEPFNTVIAGNGMQFRLVKGKEQVEIEVEENLLPYFETNVENGELSIRVKEEYSIRPSENKPINVVVYFQSLHSIKAYDGASIISNDTIQTEKLYCKVQSGATVSLLTKAIDIKAEINSAAELILKGGCTNLDALGYASADIKAFDLICEERATVTVYNSARAHVNILGELEATAYNSADVIYRGNPRRVHGDGHSAGRIRPE